MPFAPARIAGLVGQWLDVVELTVDLELAHGDPARLLPDLYRLVVVHPYRESLWVRLAKSLYRLGRHADALAQLRTVRRLLAEDLGLDPSPTLRDLEHAILVHDPGLGAAAATRAPSVRAAGRVAYDTARPAQSPSARIRIQRPELAERLIGAARIGPVLVLGEAGVGKSTLVGEVIDALRSDGSPAVIVTVAPDPPRPMDAIAGLLEALAAAIPESWREQCDGRPRSAAVVAHLLRQHTAAAPAPTSREELLNELIGVIERVLTASGGWLVIEDCQWLDASSAEVVAGCLRARGRAVLTSRRRLDRFGAAWAALPVVEVPPFDETEVSNLVAAALPDRAHPDLVAELRARTGGNALFLMLVLDVIVEGDDRWAERAETLRSTVDERTAGLSRRTREVLQLAGLLGVTFSLEVVQRARPHALGALREAEEEGLVRIDMDGRVSFLHGLIAEAMTGSLPRGLLVSWHDELCYVLLATGAAPAAVALQAVGAAELDPRRAARACRDAAGADAAVFEWRTAIGWAREGLSVVGQFEVGGDRVEAELWTLLGTGLRRTAQPESDIALLRAAELGRAVDAPDVSVGAVTELCLHGPTTQAGTVDARALRELENALAMPVADARRAGLLAAAATLMTVSDRSDRARALYLEAVATAERADDLATSRSVYLNAHLGLSHPADLVRRRAAADALAAFDDPEARWETQFLRFGLALIDADRRSVDAALAELRLLTPGVRQRERERGLLQVEAVHAHLRGDLSAAEQLAESVLAACLEAFSESWSKSVYATLIFPVRETQGRLGELGGAVAALAAESPDFVTWRALTACVGHAAGQPEVVARELARLTADGFELAEDLTWTAVATMLCRPIWWTGDRDAAAALAPLLTPYAGQMSWNGLGTHGPVDAGLACLADVLNDVHGRRASLASARFLIERSCAPHLWWPELDRLSS